MEPSQFCIILRGPGGAGKSALARALQVRYSSKTAVIGTDLFNWTIVPGEDDKAVVYENVVALATNYLHRGYNVIIEGLIILPEERGALEAVHEIAEAEGVSVVEFYCQVPKDVALKRSAERGKDVPSQMIEQWWDLAETDKANASVQLVELNMTADLDTVATSVLDTLMLGAK